MTGEVRNIAYLGYQDIFRFYYSYGGESPYSGNVGHNRSIRSVSDCLELFRETLVQFIILT